MTSFNALATGIKRYRDAGGKRAMVGTIDVDLSAPSSVLDDSDRFHLRCGAEEAALRLNRLVELGFDDALLRPRIPRDQERARHHNEADPSEEQLRAIRALVPR
jgi:hypothetical protein